MNRLEKSLVGKSSNVVIVGVALSLAFWAFEVVVHYFALGTDTLGTAIFPEEANELWMRFVVLAIIAAFTLYARSAVLKVRQREARMTDLKDEWEAVVDSVGDPLFIHDREFRIVRCNRTYRDMVKLDYREIIGRPYYELFPKMAGPMEVCKKAVRSGHVDEQEEELYVPEAGRTYRVRYFPFPMKGPDGNEMFFNHVMEDITEAKRAKEEQESSEVRYRNLVESSVSAIITIDEQRNIIQWNSAASRIFGYSVEEVIGRPVDRIVPEQYRAMHVEGVRRFLETGVTRLIGKTVEVEAMRKDGSPISVEISLFTHVNNGVRAFTGMVADVTARRRAEAEAALKAELLDSTTDSIILSDFKGNFVYLNEAACASRGYSKDELMSINLKDLDAPEYALKIPLRMEEIRSKGMASFESAHMRKDGTIMPIDVSARLLRHEGKDLILASIRDITERRRSEEKLRDEMDVTANMLSIVKSTAQATDLQSLMKEAANSSARIAKCDVCLFYSWDPEFRQYRPGEAYGLREDQSPLFFTSPLDDKALFDQGAFASGAVVLFSHEVCKDVDGCGVCSVYRWLEGITRAAVIPIVGKTGPLGLIVCIYLGRNGKGEFAQRDLLLMRGISDQVSVSFEQARLHKEALDKALELSSKVETIRTMNEIDRSILSALDKKVIVETATLLVAKVVPCDRATVVLIDRERGGFVYEAGFGLKFVAKGALTPFEDTIATEIVRTGRTQYIADLKEMEGSLPRAEMSLLSEGFLSHIRVPLVIKGEIVGVLTVGSRRIAAFTPEHLSTLEKLSAQISVALGHARLITDLEELFLGTVKTLAKAIDAKSHWTMGHSERVTAFALEIGKAIGLAQKELKRLELGALLHDIGKLGTLEEILNKPSALTDDELKQIRMHTVSGVEILEPIKQLKDIIPMVKYHHEAFDGRGYPEGLRGEDIPLTARILCVADAVDAMSADRPYRKGLPKEVIMAELKRCSGAQFDPRLVGAFLGIWGNAEPR